MSSAAVKDRPSRLNFRLPESVKRRIEDAALISGVTTTDFAIAALANSADEVIEKYRVRRLSDRDRDRFLELLENPPAPNKALVKAAERYKKLVKK